MLEATGQGVPAATLGILKVFIHGEAMCWEALG